MSFTDTFKSLRVKKPAPPAYQPSLSVPDTHHSGGHSQLESRMGFGETRAGLPSTGPDEGIALPFLGRRSITAHQRILSWLLIGALLLLGLLTVYAFIHTNRVAQQIAAAGQALMQSQRLAKSVTQALDGQAPAFGEVADSAGVLVKAVRGLQEGDDSLAAVGGEAAADMQRIRPFADQAEKNAATIAGRQAQITQAVAALRAAGTDPARLGRDLDILRSVAQELRAAPVRDGAAREQFEQWLKQQEATRAQVEAAQPVLQALDAARKAQAAILADAEPLRTGLQDLQSRLAGQSGLGVGVVLALSAAALVALLSAAGLARAQLEDSRQRQGMAEHLRQEAERQQQDAKRVNDANQAAILRLMNELQAVAEGDLTQQATVTEDITGAIADSVNYTVEELRALVGSVQNTAGRVAQTTAQVDSTSTELLAASTEQLREIRETGRSVLEMASRINEVSQQAQQSATVAHQSLQAADTGLTAVQNAIGGMNAIRDQIQDTSKRIKRLGESSQEIGEITELISDITEQTNVLALNAAIQAASAGDAGRGFSVVAEEVQRLAERSGDATRQIAALVKAIQTDTQDAVAAMERSTQGVVAGARLSDSAGTALSEIDSVSRRLAELIEQIAGATSREAELANVVADNIQHIFAVTEQTGEGTRDTAHQVRELSRMAEELRRSVERFKIA